MVDKYKFISRLLFAALWIQLCWGFVCTDLIPALESVRGYVNLLTELIFLLLGIITIRNRRDIIVLLSFLVIVVISMTVNGEGIMMFTNGVRDFIGLLFAAPIIRWCLTSSKSEEFVKSVDKMLYIFLWIQLFCLVSQFLRFGACDRGGGSLGNGYSGTVSTLIYVISFYLINKKWDLSKTYMQNIWANRTLIFLLFPTALNETKISFLYIIGYFFLLTTIDKSFIRKSLITIPIIAILVAMMGVLYFETTNAEQSDFDTEYFKEYLVGEDIQELMELAILVQDEEIETENLWVVDLPRYGRFVFIPEILRTRGGGLIFGAGIGQYKGGSYVSKSGFAAEYDWWLKGSVILSFFIVVQLGFVGLVWLLYNLFSLMLIPDHRKRGMNVMLFMIFVTLLILIYNDMLRNFYACFIFFYIYMRGLQPESEGLVEDGSVSHE